MRARTIARLLPAALLLIAGSGCVTRQVADDLQRQVDELQGENFRLRKELTETRVRARMHEQTGSAPARPAKIPPSVIESGGPESADRAVSVIYSEPITDAAGYERGIPARPGQFPAVPGAAQGPGHLLAKGRASLDAGDPEGALEAFRRIVAAHASDPAADDAQFGIGECYFQMGRYEEAIDEYRKVGQLFPYGDQVPYAFLKVGFAHLALDQRDLALDSFRTVSEAYPGTEAATVARQQIAHLSRP